MFRQNLLDSENLQSLCHIEESLRSREAFPGSSREELEPTRRSDRESQTRCVVARENVAFPVNRGMVETEVETPPAKGISDSSLFVGGQYDRMGWFERQWFQSLGC